MNVIFARRFFWLLALGLIPLSSSWLSPELLTIAALLDAVVVLAAIIDSVTCEPPGSLRVRRSIDAHLALKVAHPVELLITNRSRRKLVLWVRDEYPVGMIPSETDFTVELGPGQSTTIHYTVRPFERGDFQFGDTVVRIRGRVQLVWRQWRYATSQSVRVYPDFRQAKHIELMAHRHRQMLVGSRRMRFRGHGREFESLRDFVVGDEIRHIAWTATARRGKLVTRQYQVERYQNIMIMLDTGRMMKAEIDELSKLDHAINAALSLAYVGLTGGDNVGLLIFGRQVKTYIPARHRPDQLGLLLDALYNVRAELIEPDYAGAFRYFMLRNTKRSLVVILTDIIDREGSEELLAYTSLLAGHHLPLLVSISDVDLWNSIRRVPTDLTEVYQQAVAEELLRERQEALALITRRGGLVVDVPIGHLAVELVNRYLEVKEQGWL